MTFRGRCFGFSAPDPDSSPKPERPSDPTGHSGLRSDPAASVSGESNFESAEEEPRCLERTGQEENPNLEERTIEEEPYQETKTELDPLASSTFLQGELWTEPRPPISPIENLFSQLLQYQQMNPNTTNINTMATPTSNGTKEIALKKPNAFNGDRENFKEFLQSVEVYMDVNHEVYQNALIKIAFILSFMNSGPAATWKYQFIDEKLKQPPPTNPNDELRQYANSRKELVNAFSMFDSVGDALNKLWALRMKMGSSIDEHIAKFKLLAAAAEIDPNHALTIKLFKETLVPALRTRMMRLEMPLMTGTPGPSGWTTNITSHNEQ